MRKPLVLFAAASLSLGAFAFMGYDSAVFGADQQKTADTSSGSSRDSSSSSTSSGLGSSSSSTYGTSSSSASLPQGVTKSTQADESGIRSTISQVVTAVLKEDGIKQFNT